jgi:phospholipase/carboxylesterase
MVPEQLGKMAIESLSLLGHEALYKSYPMDHEVCPQEIADISAWLQSVLGAA